MTDQQRALMNKITSPKLRDDSDWFYLVLSVPDYSLLTLSEIWLRFAWGSLGEFQQCPVVSKHRITEVVSLEIYILLAQRHVFCLRISAFKQTPPAASIWRLGWLLPRWIRPFRPSMPTMTASSPARNSSRRNGVASSLPIRDGLPCLDGRPRGLLLRSHFFLEREIWKWFG